MSGFYSNGVDLNTLYDSAYTTTTTTTTGYFSTALNKDVGSYFTLYSNLAGGGKTGTAGGNCGFKLSNGTDIGSLLCVKGSVSGTGGEVTTNGNFSSPDISINSSSYYSNPSITNWTISSGNGVPYPDFIGIGDRTTFWTSVALPSGTTQYLFVQPVYTSLKSGPIGIYQPVALQNRQYNLSFYYISRNYGIGTKTSMVNVCLSQLTDITIPVLNLASNLAVTNHTAWTLFSINFTPAEGIYNLYVYFTNSAFNASADLCLSKLSLKTV
jgi:hypothetical protein